MDPEGRGHLRGSSRPSGGLWGLPVAGVPWDCVCSVPRPASALRLECKALTQQAKEKLSEREETNRDNFGSPECNKIRTMDLKFNNSRKYVSITVPSKTQTMSPHIKSIDDIVVLGINLSKFNKLAQFFICVAGVFVFYLIYGYLQVKNAFVMLVIYSS